MMHAPFDASRAWLRGPDLFPRWRAAEAPTPLSGAGLPEDDELVIAEVDGERVALRVIDIGHPHGAELELAGKLRYVSW